MMLKKMLFGAAIFAIFTACNAQTEGEKSDAAATTPAEDDRHFGEIITADDAITLPQLLSRLNGQDSVEVKLVGNVQSVCQKKGCWMNIVEKEEEGPAFFVKFKDYGFFVPKDIAGRKVIMEGFAFREFTPVDELKHMAEDAGKSQEEIDAITMPKEELKFLASGVLLLD
jgi:hypothetical protein